MFSKNKGLAKTNSKELLLNKSGVNSGGTCTTIMRISRLYEREDTDIMIKILYKI